MSLPKIILDTDKATPIYEVPLKIRQGDTGDELQVTLGKSFEKYTDLSTVDVELIAKTPDQRLIKQAVTDKSGNTFKVNLPDEMYTNVGVFRNMYFKIGDDSTSSVKLVVLQGIGSIKEAGSYIDDFETLIKEAESYVLALKDFSDTGNAKIDNKVTELTGKMTDFVDKSKEDLDAAKAAWDTFQSSSEAAATSQRDGFDAEFNKLISDDKATFETITTNFNKVISDGKEQNATNQKDFDAAESKRENDFTSQSTNFEKRYVAQSSDFEDRFKKLISTLKSDYDSFKELLTNDVAGLNKKLTDLGKDTTALQTQADKISSQLDSVDLTQMTTNKNDIASLQTQVDNSAVGTNLLTGTSNDIKSATGDDWLIRTVGQFSYENSCQYTASVKIEKYDNPISFQVWQADANGNRLEQGRIKSVTITRLGRVSITFNAPDKNDGETIILQLAWSSGDVSGSYAWSQVKLEKGSLSTDWCPNPTEIATDGSVQTSIKNALANYSTNAEVDSKISTGVGQAKTYAEQSIKDIIGAAPATLDTIGELADAVTKNKDGVQAINDGITKKADKTELANYESKAEVISQTDYEAKKTAGTLENKFYIVTDDTEAS